MNESLAIMSMSNCNSAVCPKLDKVNLEGDEDEMENKEREQRGLEEIQLMTKRALRERPRGKRGILFDVLNTELKHKHMQKCITFNTLNG